MLSLFTVPRTVFLGNGAAPQSIVSGDFRGLGRVDVAVAEHDTSAVSVLLSNGDGSFQAPVNYSLGASLNPTFLATANLNADNKPDLVVVDNAKPGFVSVLLNNGDGTFASAVKYAVGANPVGVAIEDLNGDNKPDLVVANNGDSTLTLLFNQGNGTFGNSASFALPAVPVSITGGDFNKDNKNDVALIASGKVFVYDGTGTGSFGATPAQYNAGNFPGYIAAANLRVAGTLDLAVVDNFPGSDGVSILLNNGSGIFANGVQYDLGASPGTASGQTANSIAFGDLNNDGSMDLAVANAAFANNNGVSVLLGHGDGTFGGLTSWVADQAPVAVIMGPFDTDSKLDLAVVNQGSNDVSFLSGNGDGTFAAPPTLVHVVSPGPVVTGDFTGDGKKDFVVGNTFSMDGTVATIFAGNGDGTFKTPTTIHGTSQAKALAAAFMNADNSLDVVMLDANNNVNVFMNDGSGNFATPAVYGAGANAVSLTVGDFNGDGKPDLAIINANSDATKDGSATIYLNDGTGALTLVGQSPDVGLVPSAVTAADLDGDNRADLIVTNNNSFTSTVSVLISTGGSFKPLVSYAVDGDPTAVFAAPLRSGGKPDLAISTFFGPGLDILLNKGDGTFGASKALQAGSNPTGVLIADVTRDGNPDAVVTNDFSDSVTVYDGFGDGVFATLPQTFTVGNRPAMSATADFNGDSFTDLVTTNSNANSITLLLTAPPAATTTVASSASTVYQSSSQQVSLTATVTSSGGTVISGTETFTVLSGTTVIGTPANVLVVNGVATASYTLPVGTAAGTYVVKADYHGNNIEFASSGDSTKILTIAVATSTTAAPTVSTTFSLASQTVGLSAQVISPAGTVSEGTETFTVLQNGNTIGSPVTVNVLNGAAAANYLVPGGTAAGGYGIRAVYNGTPNIRTSSDSNHSLSINAAGTSTATVNTSTDFSPNSHLVPLSATITSGGGVVSEGTATFTVLSGGSTIGAPVTVNVSNGAATANYTVPGATALGNYSIQIGYSGSSNFSSSADIVHTLTINKAATVTTAGAASTAFSASSQIVPLQATFTSTAGIVKTGTATFTILNGTSKIGTAVTVNVASGVAAANYTIPAGTPGGTYVINVSYSGSINLAVSSDSSQSLTITAAPATNLASVASASFNTMSQTVTLNAAVTSAGGTVNEGTETFTVLQGSTTIGSAVTVNVANGAASTSYTLPAGVGGGTYTIQAVYSGTANFGSSTDKSRTLTINAATSTTTAAPLASAFSTSSQILALSATVASGAGAVNEGMETFQVLQGTTAIGSPVTVNVVGGAASASYTLPAGAAVGTYVISASYNGTGNYATSSDNSHSLIIASTGDVQFASATYSANENDPVATIILTRTGGSFGAASVTIATGGGTAPVGVDYQATTKTVTWAAGDTSPKTVSIPLLNHNGTGAATETVGLSLTQASGASLGGLAAATLTIQEIQANSLTSQLNFSVYLTRVARTAGDAIVTVIRSGGLGGTVTVQFATSDGSALAGTDYTGGNGTLTFGPNVMTQTIAIPLANNPQSGGKTINLDLSNPSGGAVLLSPNSTVLMITDPFPAQPMPGNLAVLAGEFTHDSEAKSIFVTGAYRLYLKRLPESQGLGFWINQMQSHGLTDEQLETGFISSNEYIQNHGGTGQAWVIGMYQDLLGRNPDSGGLAFWTDALAKGTSPFNVAFGFAASAEREGQRIAGDYEIFLGRPLDQAGQGFWVNQFLNGARNEDVVAGFAGSLEYYQNASKGQSNHTAWVDSAFQDIFHRDPSTDELAKWLSQMN